MTHEAEGKAERAKRRYQRGLFDSVARLYEATRPADATAFSGSGLFAAPVRRTFTRRATYSAEGVMGVESTRATSLSWPQDVRAGFNAELRQLLGCREVPLTLEPGHDGACPRLIPVIVTAGNRPQLLGGRHSRVR